MMSREGRTGGGVKGLLFPALVSVPIFGLLVAAHAWIELSIFAAVAIFTVIARAYLARGEVTYDWNSFRGRGRKSVPIDLPRGRRAIAVIESGPHAQTLAILSKTSNGWQLTIPRTKQSQRAVLNDMSLEILESLRDEWQMRFLMKGRVFDKALDLVVSGEAGGTDASTPRH
jgi:hypothetical protein